MTQSNKPGIWQIIKAVLAGAIGVQSNKNREKDFQSHSIWPFVFGGVLFTVIFVILLIVLVTRLA